ncbi:MAG: NUDIX hydrolase, partial [Burkholderiales bacterium]
MSNDRTYQAVEGAPRAAATIVLLRDVDHDVDCNPGIGSGLEVFLVRRHSRSAVLGGAWVFPGGKVDGADATIDAARHFDAAPEELHAALSESDINVPTAASIYVAAVREAFEECGVLLAQGLAEEAVLKAVEAERGGRKTFADVLAQFELKLSTRLIVPWSRWITPTMSVMSKRFDTRFFVAALPLGQIALHDSHETDESVWIKPHAALDRYWAREFDLAPPQIMTLAHLAKHDSVA